MPNKKKNRNKAKSTSGGTGAGGEGAGGGGGGNLPNASNNLGVARCKTCQVKRQLMIACDTCGFHNYCSRECQKVSLPEHTEWCLESDANGITRILHDRAFGGAVSMLLHHGYNLHGKGMIHAECSHALIDYCGPRRKPNCDERKITLTFVPAGRAVLDLQKQTMSSGQAERNEEGVGALESIMTQVDYIGQQYRHGMDLDPGEALDSRLCVVGLQDGISRYMSMNMYYTYMGKVHPANREFRRLMGKKLSLELEWEYNDDNELQLLLQRAVGQKMYNNCRKEWARIKPMGGAMAMLSAGVLIPPFAFGVELKLNPNYKPSPEEKKNSKKLSDPNLKRCGFCGACGGDSVKLKPCSRCSIVYYCDRACQLSDWKNGHKEFCKTKEERSVALNATTLSGAVTAAAATASSSVSGGLDKECCICKNAHNDTSKKLPCGHMFHQTCLLDLFSFALKQSCPICRAQLPSKKELENL